MTTLRTITGELRHTTGELLPETTIVIAPVVMVSGDGGDVAILGDAFEVTSDESGLVEFEAYEGDYDVEYPTSRGKAIRRGRVDTAGPWTMGRFLGPVGSYGPTLAQQVEDDAAAAALDAAAARAAVRTLGIANIPAFLDKLANGGQIKMALIGDSWAGTYNKILALYSPLRDLLATVRNPQGPGWVNFDGAGTDDLPGATRVISGTRTTFAYADPATAVGPDCTAGVAVDTGSAYTVTLTGGLVADRWIIGYERKSGGGGFTYSVDGGGATAVSADGAAGVVYIEVAVPGTSLNLTTTSLGTGLSYAGVLPIIDADTGFVLHRMSASGATLADFATMLTGYFEAGLIAIAPDTILFMCSLVNEVAQGRTSAQSAADMTTILSRIRTALPHADVVILTGSETGTAAGATLLEYEAALREVALADGKAGFLTLAPAIGPYASALVRGTFDVSDPSHPTEAGGKVLATAVYDRLLSPLGTEETANRLLLMPVDFDAEGDADAARPDYPEAQRILWRNVPSEPTNLGPNDWWEDPA